MAQEKVEERESDSLEDAWVLMGGRGMKLFHWDQECIIGYIKFLYF